MTKKSIVSRIVSVSLAVVILVLLFSFHNNTNNNVLWANDFENNLFRFNPSLHTIHGQEADLAQYVGGMPTFEEYYDAIVKHPNQIAIIGEVVGPSINRIVNPRLDMADASVPAASNHVLTPILVHYIMHIGADVTNTVRVGEVIDVIEGHFFVTQETQAYVNGTPLGTIVAQFGTRPMESGHRYLMFLHNGSSWIGSPYRYNSEIVLGTMLKEDIYRLTPIVPLCGSSHAWADWHRDAMARFGHLYHELPPVPPAPYNRTPHRR